MKRIPKPRKRRANSLRIFVGYDGSTLLSRHRFYLDKDIDHIEPDPRKQVIYYLTTGVAASIADLNVGTCNDPVFNALGLRPYEVAEVQLKVVKRCQLKPVQRVRSSTSSPRKPPSARKPASPK
jgi:hypothetical protein